jgi:hypothetical protein
MRIGGRGFIFAARYNSGVERIGRYILNGLAVLSLVMCIVSVALWIRSHWLSEYVGYGRANDEWAVGTDVGGVMVGHLAPYDVGLAHRSEQARRAHFHSNWLGFAYSRGGRGVAVRIPLWFVVLVTALPPIAWGWKRRRRRRVPVCGFEMQPSGTGVGR